MYPTIMSRLSRGPQCLVHGDLHVENILLHRQDGERTVYVLDWQHIQVTHPSRDFAYLLAARSHRE